MSDPEETAFPLDGSAAGVLRLAELSYTQLKALDRSKTAVIFSASPLEEHGPHLPVGTDLFEAEFIGRGLADRIVQEKPGWIVLIGPALPMGAWTFDESGTLSTRARTVRNMVLDYGAALAQQGFQYILVTNAHGGPRHIVALEEAAAAVSRRYGVRMLSVSGPILWKVLRGRFNERLESALGRPLTPAERDGLDGDAHAGVWETSLILRIRPELVDPGFQELLPQRFLLLDALRKNYPLRLGNRLGYIGSPAAAGSEFGEAAEKLLVEAAWEAARKVFESADESWQQTSVFYKIPLLRTAAPRVAAIALLIAGAAAVWWLR
jgi:creatinine amidohydrolase